MRIRFLRSSAARFSAARRWFSVLRWAFDLLPTGHWGVSVANQSQRKASTRSRGPAHSGDAPPLRYAGPSAAAACHRSPSTKATVTVRSLDASANCQAPATPWCSTRAAPSTRGPTTT